MVFGQKTRREITFFPLCIREGPCCSKCVRLPGCMYGYCDEAFECKCKRNETTGRPMYRGAYCDCRECTRTVSHT